MEVSSLKQAIQDICQEKNIPYDSVIATIAAALAVAYRKDFGAKNQNVIVDFNADDGTSRIWDVKTVVDDKLYDEYMAEQKVREQAEAEGRLEEYLEQRRQDEEAQRAAQSPLAPPSESGGQTAPTMAATPEERFDPKKHISLTEAKKIQPDIELGGEIRTELFPPASYGRMAAQTAKQVIIQRIREAERDTIYREFKGREGQMITAMIQRVEGRMVLIDLGQTTGIMPPPEQIEREHYRPGDRIKVYISSVNLSPKGPEIVVSRTHPEMVRQLFNLEVPELQNGSVAIKAIAREAGLRTKLAVWSQQKNIDPVGSLVGQRGTRVQTVISELGGEKIDIIEWSDDPVKFITNALSPAKVISIKLNEAVHSCVVEVKDDQLSLAIGKAGQNVRLAAKLSGWKIDLVGESGALPQSNQDSSTSATATTVEPTTEGEAATTVSTDPDAPPAQKTEVNEQPADKPTVSPPE